MKRKFIFIYAFFCMLLILLFNAVTLYSLKYFFLPNISFLSIFTMKQLIGDIKFMGKIYAVFFLFYLYIFPYVTMKFLYGSLNKYYNKQASTKIKLDTEEDIEPSEVIDANIILK